jgi:hypothetical protein
LSVASPRSRRLRSRAPEGNFTNIRENIIVILQATTSWLNALLALNPTMRLINARPADANHPELTTYPGSVSALINAAGRSISVPGGYAPAYLVIPAAAVRSLASGSLVSGMPSEALQLDANCCCDFQGAWASVFQQAFGFTAGTPASGPVPVLAG